MRFAQSYVLEALLCLCLKCKNKNIGENVCRREPSKCAAGPNTLRVFARLGAGTLQTRCWRREGGGSRVTSHLIRIIIC